MARLVECVPNFSEGRDLAIVDAIAARDASGAVKVMLHHLDHVEASLALDVDQAMPRDLEQALA